MGDGTFLYQEGKSPFSFKWPFKLVISHRNVRTQSKLADLQTLARTALKNHQDFWVILESFTQSLTK